MKTFEEKMKRLEEITKVLENNEESMDNSLKLFEEGLTLTKELEVQLKNYQKKINELIEVGSNEVQWLLFKIVRWYRNFKCF